MKRSFLAGILAVAAGNTIITGMEKLLYSREQLEVLEQLLLNGGSRAAIASQYPPELLNQKMFIWMVAAFVAGLVAFFAKPEHRTRVYAGIVLFMLLAAGINIYIVPHPAWLTAVLPALFVLPVYASAHIPGLLRLIKTARFEMPQQPNATGKPMAA
jgi:hypothetical protein